MVFGLNLGAEWKGFDFSMFWQGAAMFDVNLCGIYDSGIRDDTFYTRPFYADGNTPYYLVEGSWRPDNPNAKFPRLGIEARDNGGKFSSWVVKQWCGSVTVQAIAVMVVGALSTMLTLCSSM